MASFEPPVVYVLPWVLPETQGVQYALFKYYGPGPVGQSVIKVAGHYLTLPYSESNDFTGTEGVDWFLGGHRYTVSAGVAAALAADGYVVT